MSDTERYDTGTDIAEESNQLQPGDTLDDRGVTDILDEGFVTRERWSPAQGFGNTPAEMRRGETLEQRIAQEEPDASDQDWEPDGEEHEVGDRRAGRLVAPDEGAHADDEADAVALRRGHRRLGAPAPRRPPCTSSRTATTETVTDAGQSSADPRRCEGIRRSQELTAYGSSSASSPSVRTLSS